MNDVKNDADDLITTAFENTLGKDWVKGNQVLQLLSA